MNLFHSSTPADISSITVLTRILMSDSGILFFLLLVTAVADLDFLTIVAGEVKNILLFSNQQLHSGSSLRVTMITIFDYHAYQQEMLHQTGINPPILN